MTASCLVVGAGPAGFSASAWLRDLEVDHVWIDGDGAIGGTLRRVGNPIRTLPATTWATGTALAQALADGVPSHLHPRRGTLERVTEHPTGRVIARIDGLDAEWDAVILCTGTRPRRLGLDGELDTAGVEISVTRNRERYAGCAVAICGGGDAALEGALLLAPHCPVVHLVHRRDGFTAQARFIDQVGRTANIVVHAPNRVTGLERRDGRLTAVALDDGQRLEVAGLFVRVGVEAAVPAGLEHVARSQTGYLCTTDDGRLGTARIWAAGDVREQRPQSVATALGDGARAAWSVARALGFVAN